VRAPDRASAGASGDSGHILATARDIQQRRPGGPRSIWAPRRVREVGAHSPDRLGRVPRPKLCGNCNCGKPQAREHAKPCSHKTAIDAPRCRTSRGADASGLDVLVVADRQDPVGAAIVGPTFRLGFALMYVGGHVGEVWAQLDGLALPSRCMSVFGGTASRGYGFPGTPSGRPAHGRARRRLGRAVWHLADRVPFSRERSVRARVDRSLHASCRAAVVYEDAAERHGPVR
jgi:hypothetical protein